MRAFFFWEARAGGLSLAHKCNPYAGLLARALEAHDIRLALGDYAFERGWLEANRAEFDVLHLNWLHWFYRCETLEATLARLNRFCENLHVARRLGYRVVWTMHNFYPHERPFPDADHLARLMVARLADAVIAHCRYAAGLARERFYREEGLHVIPHGNFIDVFENRISREEARRQLEIPQDAFVYLFFGNARVYKGLERLIEAFLDAGGQDARLVLMTRKAFDGTYAEKVFALAEPHDRIKVFTHPFFPNEDFQIYLNASDVAVLPFSEVLTSGSAITALSFGKPVILPALGCLPELIGGAEGILYDPMRKRGLEEAMVEIRGMDLAAMGQAALARARALDWGRIAGRVAAVYRGERPAPFEMG